MQCVHLINGLILRRCMAIRALCRVRGDKDDVHCCCAILCDLLCAALCTVVCFAILCALLPFVHFQVHCCLRNIQLFYLLP